MFLRFAIYGELGRVLVHPLYSHAIFDLVSDAKNFTSLRPFPVLQENAYRPSDPQSKSIRLLDSAQARSPQGYQKCRSELSLLLQWATRNI